MSHGAIHTSAKGAKAERRVSPDRASDECGRGARLKRPVAIAEPAQPITFKISGNVIGALRAYAAAHDLTLSEVVTRAITEFVRRARRHA
jgi:hypothetical protein